jgi:L-rhamnose mutarotase
LFPVQLIIEKFAPPKQGAAMQRYGSVVGVKPEKLAEYKHLHAAVWPGVLRKIHQCNIRNYSIFLREFPGNQLYLFSYFEYTGQDFESDMKQMADDPETQRWWSVCKPCHQPLSNRADGEWWAAAEEVFHCD